MHTCKYRKSLNTTPKLLLVRPQYSELVAKYNHVFANRRVYKHFDTRLIRLRQTLMSNFLFSCEGYLKHGGVVLQLRIRGSAAFESKTWPVFETQLLFND